MKKKDSCSHLIFLSHQCNSRQLSWELTVGYPQQLSSILYTYDKFKLLFHHTVWKFSETAEILKRLYTSTYFQSSIAFILWYLYYYTCKVSQNLALDGMLWTYFRSESSCTIRHESYTPSCKLAMKVLALRLHDKIR